MLPQPGLLPGARTQDASTARSQASTTGPRRLEDRAIGGGCSTSREAAGACPGLALTGPSLQLSSTAAGSAQARCWAPRGEIPTSRTSARSRSSRRRRGPTRSSTTGTASSSAIATEPPLPTPTGRRTSTPWLLPSSGTASPPPATSWCRAARRAPSLRRFTPAPCSALCPGPLSPRLSTRACSWTGREVRRKAPPALHPLRCPDGRRPAFGRSAQSCGAPSRSGASRPQGPCLRPAWSGTEARPGSASCWSTCCPLWRCLPSCCSRASTPRTSEA
mmetsp:Transcript_28961/g.78373  ORF Transcript_28961/g.78373 Transcript_28961/m.78373 type:complete len:276 (-) Transcript_28961:388-1215(-)